MPHDYDHQYVRQLLGIRGGRQLPVLWLAVPWLGGVWWSIRVAWRLLRTGAPLDVWARLDWFFTFAGFVEAAGVGLLLSWAWLYLAWPEHPRVCCWGALAGLVALYTLPPTIAPVAPLVITACGAAAAIEQAVATHRARSDASSGTAPAV